MTVALHRRVTVTQPATEADTPINSGFPAVQPKTHKFKTNGEADYVQVPEIQGPGMVAEWHGGLSHCESLPVISVSHIGTLVQSPTPY